MDELQAHNLKEIAARYAVNHFIKPGMNIGLGTGSTAAYAVDALSERIRTEKLAIGTVVATSEATARLAQLQGITVASCLSSDSPRLDVTIDGADEVDSSLNLIKGGGGALLREKLVAACTDREIIIVDQSKISRSLGEKHSLPVMIVAYGWQATALRIAHAIGNLPYTIRQTQAGALFLSDDGLYCLDLQTGPIADPAALEAKLKAITGVVDVGLFVGLAHAVVVAGRDGRIQVLPS